jgi:hypothetical protein
LQVYGQAFLQVFDVTQQSYLLTVTALAQVGGLQVTDDMPLNSTVNAKSGDVLSVYEGTNVGLTFASLSEGVVEDTSFRVPQGYSITYSTGIGNPAPGSFALLGFGLCGLLTFHFAKIRLRQKLRRTSRSFFAYSGLERNKVPKYS